MQDLNSETTVDKIRENIAEHFKYHRQKLNLKQKEMAEKLGIERRNLASIEECRAINILTLYKFSQLIEKPIEEIITTKPYFKDGN